MSRDDGDSRPDEDVFHPLGEEWQDGLEEALEETEYDADLGLEMARDAMRVSEGELSEEAFYDRYHEAIAEEFDEEFDEEGLSMADEFEAAGSAGRLEGALSRVGVDEESRRDVMKKMSAGAGAVGLGAWGTVENTRDSEPALAQESEDHGDQHGEGTQWGMTLDLEHCDGCLSCVVACAEEHNWEQGANWMYILSYEDETTSTSEDASDPSEAYNQLIRPCQHCTDAPCEKVCPTTARHTRDSDGLVLTDYNVCIGCRYCQVACPYGVNYFGWGERSVSGEELEDDHVYDQRGRPVGSRPKRGTMGKCTFCATRQDGTKGEEYVGRTACEDACPPEVIQFGDVNDPNSDPTRYEEDIPKSRTLVRLAGEAPTPETLQEQLQGADEDLDGVIDAVEDLTEERIALMLAIDIVTEDGGAEPEGPETGSLAEQEATVLEMVSMLADHGLDLGSQDVLVRLELAEEPGEDEEFQGPSEELARERLADFAGNPQSTFKLLAEIGTHPNVTYIGDQPGPEAEQVEGPVAYDEVGQTDNRKDVLDEGTVGFDF